MTVPEDSSQDAAPDITTISVPQITDMIDPELLQQFQDTFADSVGVSVVIRDTGGKRITRPSQPNRFCSLLMKTMTHDELHEEKSAALSLRAVRSGRIEQSRSDAGFLQFAAPVMIQGRATGVLVVGDIADDETDREQMEELARKMSMPVEELRRRSSQDLSFAISLLQFAASALGELCHEGWVIRRHVEELQTLHRVSQLLNSPRHVNEVLLLVVRTVCETLEVKACGLRLLDAATGELVLKAVHGLSPQYLSKGPVPIEQSEIDRAAMEGGPVYVREISQDPRILYPAEMMREGIRSILVVGLKVRSGPIGALRIYTGEERRFHRSELALADAIANLAAIAIENAKLYEEALEKERLERELTLAAEIQTHLLPLECPHIQGFDICAINEPCRQVGGDFYDFLLQPDGRRLGVVIADVCGKSMAGALLMATTRSALRVQSEHCTTPAEIVTRVNMSLCRDTRPEEFVTVFLGKLHVETRVLHYTNAGHSPPLLYRGDEAMPLEGSGMVCGVDVETTYHESDIQLQTGDILLLYTDGLNEARNVEEQLFGLERTGRVIRDNRDRSAAEIVQMLRDEVHRFTAGREQTDDLTLVLIKVT
jgi:serine phosphatase RsbU (regulator of sigma subunit)/ligand-binding sensor protein